MAKKIMNLHEEAANLRLSEISESYGAKVYPKIRVADILPIENSGISNAEYTYALKSHFDFIVSDNGFNPQFAVEFDGESHQSEKSKQRDRTKNALCERFEFPILRITSNYLLQKYREYDLLSWLVETWFMSKEFEKAQLAGQVSWEEDFDPMLIFRMPGKTGKFPMWLSAELRVKVQKLGERGKIVSQFISHWIGIDVEGNYHGISWIWVTDDMSVVAETRMRKQQFPVQESELLSEILCFQVYDQLDQFFQGKSRGIDHSDLTARVRHYSSNFDIRAFAGTGDENPNN